MNKIRFANPNDAIEILNIYSPFILKTPITFECEVPRPYEMRRRISSVSIKFPWLVCEIDGKIAGYAFASDAKQKGAYRWNAEVAVYIKEDFQRCNIASALYYAVIEFLKLQGYYNIFAYITVPNDKSEHFHTAFGFSRVGELTHWEYKLGKWYNVAIYEKQLRTTGETEICPEPSNPKCTADIDSELADRIFENAIKIVRIKK